MQLSRLGSRPEGPPGEPIQRHEAEAGWSATSPEPATLLQALLCSIACLGSMTVASAQTFTPGFVKHRGYEQIVAGPNVDPLHGLQTTGSYGASNIALSGDGTRVWFVLYHQFSSPQHQVWTMLTDGTGAQQSSLGANTTTIGPSMFVRTNLDGSVAVFYSVVTLGSRDQDFAEKRQLFLTEQGYTYEITEAASLGASVEPGAAT